MKEATIVILATQEAFDSPLYSKLKNKGAYVLMVDTLQEAISRIEADEQIILLIEESIFKKEGTLFNNLIHSVSGKIPPGIILIFSAPQQAKTFFSTSTLPLADSIVDDYIVTTHSAEEILYRIQKVNELKQTQAQLRKWRGQYEQQLFDPTLFDYHPNAIYAFDLAGKFIYVNKAATAITGFTKEELYSFSFHKLVVTDQLEECLIYFERAKNAETLSFTTQIINKQGLSLDISVTLVPIFTQKRVTGVYGVSKDITAYKRLELITQIERNLRERMLSGASLEENLTYLLAGFRSITNKLILTVVLVEEGNSAKHIAPELPVGFKHYIDSLLLQKAANPLTEVISTQEPIYNHPHLQSYFQDFHKQASAYGLKIHFSFPVFSAKRVTASLSGFLKAAQTADEQDMVQVDRIRHIIAILIERDQLQSRAERKRKLLEEISAFVPGVLYQFKLSKHKKVSLPYYSAKMNEILDKPEDAINGHLEELFLKLIHRDDLSKFYQSIEESAQMMQPWLLDYRISKPGSKEITWIRGHSIPRKGEDGSILWNGILLDITDLKNAEQMLRIQSRAIESAAEGIVITDPYQKDNPIIFVNETFCKHTLYTKEEVLGNNCRFLQGQHTSKKTIQQIREAIQARKPFRGEILNYKKDGTPFWSFLVIAPVIDEQNKLTHFVGLIYDIHERKESEQKLLEQNQQLIKINSELDRFVYSVSHNLRAPLTSLLGLITISRLTDDSAQKEHYLTLMEKSIHKLDYTIREINEYAKNARLDLQIERINFHGLIGEVIEELSYMEEAKSIAIGVEIDPMEAFYTDRSRLRVVLLNLLSNAIKYHDCTKEKPSIHIELRLAADGVQLKVKDNGVGIEGQYQDKIFTMFFRANSQSTGSGLGLYIVKENVTKMKGSLHISSTLYEGSEFIIDLPNLKDIS